jgi:Na+/melibiose symporter-like transporter
MADQSQSGETGHSLGKAVVGVQTAVQKLSVTEKVGYSMADAAANFVFMTMILFQKNFYTDVFGLTAVAASAILLFPRLWDAVVDPIVGILADRTNTRWGKFRPWVLFTAVPWAIIMILAYSAPSGWSMTAMIIYAAITNTLLMTVYSMNNMPYSALGGVMTGDVNERAKLNSYRFVAVNVAQFIVGGFTLPLVAKFASQHAAGGDVGLEDTQYGWRVTMTIWAVLCTVMFMITFITTRERILPPPQQKSNIRLDFRDLIKTTPWIIMFAMTLFHFGVLSFRGGALYDYYHHYADKTAMYDWISSLHLNLTQPPLAPGEEPTGFVDGVLGYVVHADESNIETSNVADVAYSLINMMDKAVTILFIVLTASFARRFGKKLVAAVGFGLASLTTFAFYWLPPTNIWGMVTLTLLTAIAYAPTIALVWAIYADVADYCELKTGRRFTGVVFATIGFALKSGLALGAASILWVYSGFFNYDTKLAGAAEAIRGYRICSSLLVSILFAICTILLICYPLGKRATLEMAEELAERRKKFDKA